MPRAPVAGREIRRRSRNGCWNCKARKVKCGEEKPRCSNCTRLDEDCDYKIRLSWGGRPLKKKMLEQGCHMDDPSQNIPGAGHFSITQSSFTTAPPASSNCHTHHHSSSLSPTSPNHNSTGGIRKTSGKTGVRGGMSVFQNVFSVCDAIPPAQTTPSTAVPRYGATIPSQPFYQTAAVALDGELYYTIKDDSYLPYTHGSHLTSPCPSLTTLTINSPTNAPSSLPQSPMLSYADPSVYQHSLGSMPPRIKTSMSPEIQQYNIAASGGMVPSVVIPSSADVSSLGPTSDYYATPLTPPQLSVEHQHMHAYGNKGMRRVSVENLLATPASSHHNYSAFGDRFFPSIDEYAEDHSSLGQFQLGSQYGEEDVEEIDRYEALYSPASSGQGNLVPHPVYRAIPRALHPLPPMLLENTQNAMYFHHFLTQTASLLVPVDCGGNPFKSILPKMAMQDSSLLNLLLAYSASHQARLIKQAEPAELVSSFLGQTVSSLNRSLNDPIKQKSDSTLATAIMLCSYEIISPNPFARGINWQTHLAAVRKIVMARGGVDSMNSGDEVSFFLSRWFAYLDVLGSLSGKDNQYPLFNGKYWNLDLNSGMSDSSVDCFFGFTNSFIGLLAQIGDMARKCDVQKREYVQQVNSLGYNSTATEWVADDEILNDAARLREQLEDSRQHAVGDCPHGHHEIANEINGGRGPLSDDDRRELLATNDAFHWAAQVHLLRRVFNYPTNHQHVQHAVHGIMDAIQKVREDGAAENCLLFPLFTAGCESIDGMDRDYTLRRMLRVENSGLIQIHLARILMQNVWQTGRSWEVLSDGEFIG